MNRKKRLRSVCARCKQRVKSNLRQNLQSTNGTKSMEWCQVVKLLSATIPCFFLLLFIRGKRQGLDLRKIRLVTEQIETKAKRMRQNGCDYQRKVVLHCKNIQSSPFLPPLSPTTPITPYNPPNSPLKQINCLRPPRQNGATTGNDNRMLCKSSFPLQLSISKSYTVSQQVRPLPASTVRFYWLNMGIPSI